MRAGDRPYRSYLIEYPPGALAAFLVPELSAAPEHFAGYNKAFERWMALCGVAMIVALAVSLAALGRSLAAGAAAVGLAALSPLLLGSVILSRFDLWPTVLSSLAVAALLVGYRRLAAVMFGLAIAAKLYPAVCVPIAFAWIWRRYGRRAAFGWAAIVACTVAAIFLPFAVLAPAGLLHSFSFQIGRPLQIESLGAAVLISLHWLIGLPLSLHQDHGSTNLVGGLPRLVGNVSTAVQVTLVVVIWTLFARGPASRQRLAIAFAAALASFMAFGKVFSPQYMIWLIPFVPLIGGRRGLIAGTLLALSLALTHAWFPNSYGEYVYDFRITQSVEVLFRDLAIAACALLLTSWLAVERSAVERSAAASGR